jgi:DNA-binding NtrC family response regulator
MSIPDNQRQQILVVDDDQSVSDSLERILKAAGYEVKTANSGMEALCDWWFGY